MKRELGSFETATVLTNDYAPFNIVCVLQISELPKPEILNESFHKLQHALLKQQYLSRSLHSEGKILYPDY